MFLTFEQHIELYGLVAAVLIAGIAAIMDWRTGRIPNYLTLPPLVIAPIVYGVAIGSEAVVNSILGLLLCGLIPFFLWRQGAIGGGDVKITAAIGAVTGTLVGLEIEFISFLVGVLYALGRLAWEGQLLRTFANAFYLALNPLLPKKWRRKINPTLLSTVRMGGSFLVGAVLILLARHPYLYQ